MLKQATKYLLPCNFRFVSFWLSFIFLLRAFPAIYAFSVRYLAWALLEMNEMQRAMAKTKGVRQMQEPLT